jgi:hypothetical protein
MAHTVLLAAGVDRAARSPTRAALAAGIGIVEESPMRTLVVTCCVALTLLACSSQSGGGEKTQKSKEALDPLCDPGFSPHYDQNGQFDGCYCPSGYFYCTCSGAFLCNGMACNCGGGGGDPSCGTDSDCPEGSYCASNRICSPQP